MKLELSPDWTEFLRLLISHRVRFVLVGGHAVAAWAEPRLTEDLDVFVDPTPENAARLHSALAAFGFGSLLPAADAFTTRGKVWMLGRKPNRIDILTGIDGVDFKQAWTEKVEVGFVSRPLYVIGREALLANKRAAARPKDLADVAAIERHGAAKPTRRRAKRK
jgi:hypothetical protein